LGDDFENRDRRFRVVEQLRKKFQDRINALVFSESMIGR
jgi:hypothetical protein